MLFFYIENHKWQWPKKLIKTIPWRLMKYNDINMESDKGMVIRKENEENF